MVEPYPVRQQRQVYDRASANLEAPGMQHGMDRTHDRQRAINAARSHLNSLDEGVALVAREYLRAVGAA